ncbi:MAG: glycosyltransferase family 4 protein [Verrucomicrobia bacterium]|nr:glycosyltransferase family 4 protein [Verrucomicrobiota bacterium]
MNGERRSPSAARGVRLLVLCYEWPPVGGGGGRAARDVAEALARRGHRVRVQTVRLLRMARREVHADLELYRTWGFRLHPDRCNPAEMAGYLLTSFLPVLRHLKELRPDVIHAHFAVPTGPLALAASWLGHVPYVVTAHLGDVPGTIPDQTDRLFRWLNPAIKPVWKRAAAITAVSEFVADLAAKAYARRPDLIPNGIDLRDQPPPPTRAGSPPRLLFVGRLNPQKNLPFLFRVLAELKDLPWTLDVVGNGEDGPNLKRFVEAQRLWSKVRFHGWLQRAEVDALLTASDVLMIPSTVEGLPLALLEGLKFGLAIVASDLPPLRDLVEPGRNGFLVDTGRAEAWTARLREVLADASMLLEMRRHSWRLAKRFDLETITDEYERVYRRVIGTGS